MKPYRLQKDNLDHDLEAWSMLRGGEPADYCSREGAQALKDKIEAYWRERGQSVMVNLHNVGFHPAIRAARFDLRSDMVNGMPRANSKKASVAAAAQDLVTDDFDAKDDAAFE